MHWSAPQSRSGHRTRRHSRRSPATRRRRRARSPGPRRFAPTTHASGPRSSGGAYTSDGPRWFRGYLERNLAHVHRRRTTVHRITRSGGGLPFVVEELLELVVVEYGETQVEQEVDDLLAG